MHNSIFSRFFNLCFALVAGAVICMGAVHIFLSIETYQKDKKNELIKYTSEAVQYAEVKLITGDSRQNMIDSVGEYFKILADYEEADFYMTDGDGNIIACSEAIESARENDPLPASVLARVKTDEPLYAFGTLGGYYSESWFNLGYRISYGDENYFIFGRLPTDSMRVYMIKLIISFVAAALIIMAAVNPILRFAIMRIVKPVGEMTLAAKRFGAGDFSQKLDIYDSSELGYLGNALNEMASSLEEIEESRKSFVSNVSHELKTPMTTIGGFVDGILDGTIPKSEHRYYLRIVSEEVDRLARLVRSMLNISKYESGEVELQTESFEASALIFKTVLLFEKRIEAKNVNVEGLDGGRFYLNADIDLTQQVIYNLTENAVKFVNDGGTISFSFENRGDFTAVTIRNTGEGLKQNEISKVFDKFYKTDESRGKDKTGVGLGLSIVSQIIRLHNGAVLVRSKPNEYTEFEFTMPTGFPPPKRAERSGNDTD